MDALIDPSFFGALPDEASWRPELRAALGETRSYEDLLDRDPPVRPGAACS